MTTLPVRFAMLAAVSCALALPSASTVRAQDPSSSGTPKQAEPPAEPPPVDPDAKALFERAREYLGSLTTFRVHAETTRDTVVGDKYKLQKAEVVDLTVSRPSQMRVDIKGDERDQLIVDDGKTLWIYSRPEKYYASMSALPTLQQTIDVAAARYGVSVPLIDMIFMASGEDFTKNVTRARDIGPSLCGSRSCEHLAFRGKVDWQVWIDKGEKPLLLKIVITTRDQPTQPQFSAVLSWDTSPKIDDATFAFTPPEGATQMALPKPKETPKK
jgi:hypothetical protein